MGTVTEKEEQLMRQRLERLKLAAGAPDALIVETRKCFGTEKKSDAKYLR